VELNRKLISIVIPVYNVKEYLEECLISVVNQSYSNLEIILVDDGSKDGSTEICKKFADNDSRIKLVLQENHGVAHARKAGVQVSTGDYLGFVDADDYIDGEYIEKLVAFMQKADVVTAGYYIDYETSRSEAILDKLAFGYYKTDDEYRYVIENMIRWNCGEEIGVSPFIWNKLYRRNILLTVFEEVDTTLYFGEDSDVLYRYLLQAKSIYISDVCGYHYRMRSNSAVHSTDDRYLLNVGKLYWGLKSVFSKHEGREVLVKQLQTWIMRMVDKAPRRMGFPVELHSMEFLFPYINLLDGKRVALYGHCRNGCSEM